MLIYGYHPVREALRHRPHEVRRVLVGRRRRGERRQRIEALCRRHRIHLAAVSEEELSRLSGGVHNGFLAELHASPIPSSTDRDRPADLVVLLEDVQDPRNLGAILRICEAAGVDKVILRDRGTAPITATVAKAAAGATEWLNIERVPNSVAAIKSLKAAGFWVYGTDPAGSAPWQSDLSGKVALCFGGEAEGLRARTRKECDALLGLPMRGAIASLNVSAAAAAIVYEVLRQRASNLDVAASPDLPPGRESG